MNSQFDEEFQSYALNMPGAPASGSANELGWDPNLDCSDSATDRHDQTGVDQLSFNFPRLTLDGTFQPSQNRHSIGFPQSITEPSSQNQTFQVNGPAQ